MRITAIIIGRYKRFAKMASLTAAFCWIMLLAFPSVVFSAQWSTTEMHIQYGDLDVPSFAGSGSVDTTIMTLQNASGWKYGDSFFFFDYLNDSRDDGFNDADLYAEVYVNFSLGKISGKKISYLPGAGKGGIKDVGFLLGINMAADAKVVKYLPGLRLSWETPGFAFLNSDITAYIDDSRGVSGGGAPAEENSYMLDINWAYPFSWGSHDFSIEGHMEYIGERRNEFGAKVKDWFFAQPQFRYDLGKTLFGAPKTFFVGGEWQYWRNKLGDGSTDENALQALIVWRF